MKYKFILLAAITTIILVAVRPSTEPLEAASGIYSDSLHFTTTDFAFETMGKTNASTPSIYTSPPIESPLPFNVLFPSWTIIAADMTFV